MQYRNDQTGRPISLLGYGCMRFTRKGAGIDLEKAEREVLAAIGAGVNYFDTAYIYPGSEAALGEILDRNHCRDQVRIATKLPQYLVRGKGDFERYFAEELRRLRTDHVDFYLMHMLTDVESWHKLEAAGVREWLDAKRAAGQIGQVGFSFHGNTEMFKKLLEVYPWNFCQIQYNYLDEHSQAGRAGLEAAAAKGLPVIIMEPLRGGKLVNLLPPEAKRLFAESPRGWTPAEWALRWLWDQPAVTCVLSGMNDLKMIEENCRIADEVQPGALTKEDFALLERVKTAIQQRVKAPCTGCGYCMPCPKGVDIPGAFRCYNEMFTEHKRTGRREYWQVVGLRKEPAFATQCVGCGKCESHCPQHLPIRALLKEADRALRPPHYRVAGWVARKFLFGRKA
ncbi:MAG TPA: aldo/keto reductase [Candidatus Gemmiger avicola]|uniref:Aldo/keto reductase n=1 Tax=Candidatus Gemmiger avicola TaxID=2838605 RepID=A0A9D2M7V6_9FIRM|nr:aldo/keto reductase [Candidatus Gemmiger avicola]